VSEGRLPPTVPATVYLVDDDESVRRSLARLLRLSGYEVVTLAGAEAFLELPSPTSPACLVLDIRMPGMNGLELHRRITGTAREVPVIFITGHGDEALRQQAIAAGAVDALFKPVDGDVLLGAIERALLRRPPVIPTAV
jgi:FixJ family two-component response regulator